jgi:hypothetical protein
MSNSIWIDLHNIALRNPRGLEVPIVSMLRAWKHYADMHQEHWQSPIGEDYVLGPAWVQIGQGIRELLNGDCGRLDCGSLDSMIINSMDKAGIDTSEL